MAIRYLTRKEIHALTDAEIMELGFTAHEVMAMNTGPYAEKFRTVKAKVEEKSDWGSWFPKMKPYQQTVLDAFGPYPGALFWRQALPSHRTGSKMAMSNTRTRIHLPGDCFTICGDGSDEDRKSDVELLDLGFSAHEVLALKSDPERSKKILAREIECILGKLTNDLRTRPRKTS